MNNMVIFLPPLAWSQDTLKVICLQSCWLMELVSLKTDLDINSVFYSCLCRSFSRNVVETAPHLRVCEQKGSCTSDTSKSSYWDCPLLVQIFWLFMVKGGFSLTRGKIKTSWKTSAALNSYMEQCLFSFPFFSASSLKRLESLQQHSSTLTNGS